MVFNLTEKNTVLTFWTIIISGCHIDFQIYYDKLGGFPWPESYKHGGRLAQIKQSACHEIFINNFNSPIRFKLIFFLFYPRFLVPRTSYSPSVKT